MAKKMTKAELDAYFAEVLSRYNDTPIAAYFEKDITAILESAQSGAKKSLKVAEKQEVYNNLAQMVNALDNKIVGYLGELKDNLTNGDVVLLKASNSLKFIEIVNALKGETNEN